MKTNEEINYTRDENGYENTGYATYDKPDPYYKPTPAYKPTPYYKPTPDYKPTPYYKPAPYYKPYAAPKKGYGYEEEESIYIQNVNENAMESEETIKSANDLANSNININTIIDLILKKLKVIEKPQEYPTY